MNDLNTKYGLHSRVKLELLSKNHIGILKLVKSRIIQKDAIKIIDQANVIQEKDTDMRVSLICHNNICSKSIALLDKNNIDVIFRD